MKKRWTRTDTDNGARVVEALGACPPRFVCFASVPPIDKSGGEAVDCGELFPGEVIFNLGLAGWEED